MTAAAPAGAGAGEGSAAAALGAEAGGRRWLSDRGWHGSGQLEEPCVDSRDKRARRVLAPEPGQEPLRRLPVGGVPRLAERQFHEACRLPERVVAVRAGGEPADDRLVGPGDRTVRIDGRRAGRARGLLTLERPLVERGRALGRRRRRPRQEKPGQKTGGGTNDGTAHAGRPGEHVHLTCASISSK